MSEDKPQIDKMLDKAGKGDPKAKYDLAILFEYSGETDKAMELFREAAEAGHVGARYELAHLYRDKDPKEAFKFCRLSAEQGHPASQYILADFYKDGVGTEKDSKEAFKYYRLAADQGIIKAMYQSGICYQKGIGVEKDLKEAARFYRLAAEEDDDAPYQLAVCYEAGIGVEKDAKKAVNYYTIASNRGNSDARYALGLCYEQGKGVEKNLKKAWELYRSGAILIKNPGSNSLELAEAKASDLAKILAKEGDADVLLKLGWSCADKKESARYYALSGARGNAEATYKLAQYYEHGEGVEKNIKAAMQLYALAADKKYVSAQWLMAEEYESGQKIPQDFKKAAELYTELADQGSDRAQYKIGTFYAQGIGVEKDAKRAAEFYKKADSREFSPFAEFSLAGLYEKGEGVKKDPEEALRLYQSAATKAKSVERVFKSEEYVKFYKKLTHLSEQATAKALDLQYNIAENYMKNGQHDKAMKLYKEAAEQGHLKSYSAMGLHMIEIMGDKVKYPEDYRAKAREDAFLYLKSAADEGDSLSRSLLAEFFLTDPDSDELDFCEAFANYTPSAKENDAIPQYRLAQFYRHCPETFFYSKLDQSMLPVVEKDLKEASRLYWMAAEQGDIDAQFELARWYEIGEEVNDDKKIVRVGRDREMAIQLYKRAAAGGHTQAQKRLEMLGLWEAKPSTASPKPEGDSPSSGPRIP
jgi:TPR repeat protein